MDGQLIATVASDASGRVLGDAELRVRYRRDNDPERTVDTIKVPWMANQDQVVEVLQGYGYAVDTWDLIADDHGYTATATLALQTWWREPAVHNSESCRSRGKGICVQARFEQRSKDLVLISKFLCDVDGELFTIESNGN